jgi:DDE superfamily endonuclease
VLDDNIGGIWGPGAIFQQDNAKIYKAKATMEWFDQYSIVVMDWPPYSPDMNPIENMWSLLKRKLYVLFPNLDIEIKGVSDEMRHLLFRRIYIAWEALEPRVWEAMVQSMPRRIGTLIAAKGWHTKY